MSNEIDRAEKRAMACLNGWIDAVVHKFDAIQIHELKRRMVSYFREYETEIESIKRYSDNAMANWSSDVKIATQLKEENESLKNKLSSAIQYFIEKDCECGYAYKDGPSKVPACNKCLMLQQLRG